MAPGYESSYTGTGGSSGASPAPSYITITTTPLLPNERSLAGTTNQITLTDGGAGGAITLSLPQSIATSSSVTFGNVTLGTGGALRTGVTAADTLLIQARDVDGTAYATFITLTAGDTPTCDLATGVTIGGAYVYRASGTDVAVADGGTGKSSWTQYALIYADTTTSLAQFAAATNGQIVIGSTGAAPVLAEITGTANQITSTSGAGTITLSLPQDIATSSAVTFGSAALTTTQTIASAGFTQFDTTLTLAPTADKGTDSIGLSFLVQTGTDLAYNLSGKLTGIYGGVAPSIGSSKTLAAVDGVNCYLSKSGSGTVTTARLLVTAADIAAGTCTTLSGLYVEQPSSSGTLTNYYGIYIEDPAAVAATLNYSIFSAGGANALGGSLIVGSTSAITSGALLEASGSWMAGNFTTTALIGSTLRYASRMYVLENAGSTFSAGVYCSLDMEDSTNKKIGYYFDLYNQRDGSGSAINVNNRGDGDAVYIRLSAPDFEIAAVDTGTKTFTVAGDKERNFNAGVPALVTGSTANDGTYTVVSSTYSAGPDTTAIVVSEAIPDATVDGNIEGIGSGVAVESATWQRGSKGFISTLQRDGGAYTGYTTLYSALWYSSDSLATTVPLYGMVYLAGSLGNSLTSRKAATATVQKEWRIWESDISRTLFAVYNDGKVEMQSAAATAGTTTQDAPDLRMWGAYWSGSATVVRSAIIRHNVVDTTPTSQLDFLIGVSGSEAVEFTVSSTQIDCKNNAVVNANGITLGTGNLDMNSNDITNLDDLTFAGSGSVCAFGGGTASNLSSLTMTTGTGSVIDMQTGYLTAVDHITFRVATATNYINLGTGYISNIAGLGAAGVAETNLTINKVGATITQDADGNYVKINNAMTSAAAGTHALLSGLHLAALAVTSGGATITESATLNIAGAPTAGTTPWALRVAAGNTYLAGQTVHAVGTAAAPAVTFTGYLSTGFWSNSGVLATVADSRSHYSATNDFLCKTDSVGTGVAGGTMWQEIIQGLNAASGTQYAYQIIGKFAPATGATTVAVAHDLYGRYNFAGTPGAGSSYETLRLTAYEEGAAVAAGAYLIRGYSGATGVTSVFTLTTAGDMGLNSVDAVTTVRGTGFIADGDPGGTASCITLTNVVLSPDGGEGDPTFAKMPTGYAEAQSGWIKLYNGTATIIVPGWVLA